MLLLEHCTIARNFPHSFLLDCNHLKTSVLNRYPLYTFVNFGLNVYSTNIGDIFVHKIHNRNCATQKFVRKAKLC